MPSQLYDRNWLVSWSSTPTFTQVQNAGDSVARIGSPEWLFPQAWSPKEPGGPGSSHPLGGHPRRPQWTWLRMSATSNHDAMTMGRKVTRLGGEAGRAKEVPPKCPNEPLSSTTEREIANRFGCAIPPTSNVLNIAQFHSAALHTAEQFHRAITLPSCLSCLN